MTLPCSILKWSRTRVVHAAYPEQKQSDIGPLNRGTLVR
jgi:hypothetical protein